MRARIRERMPAGLPGFLLALCIGTAGGYAFNLMSMPLAWMLGSMTACTLASILRLPIAPFEPARPYTTAVIGVLLGSSFSMAIFTEAGDILVSFLVMAGYLAFSTIVGTVYFMRLGGFDRITAFFSAIPGGLAEMVTLGHANGGDSSLIALVHSARILLVVTSLPYVVMLVSDADPATIGNVQRGARYTGLEPATLLWIASCGGAGLWLGRMLRLPARFLLGPMLLSGLVHISGVSNFQIPYQVVVVAQIMLGTLIGCRFRATSPKRILQVLGYSAGLVAVLLAVLVVVVEVARVTTGGLPEKFVLAYSPGGMTEMSLVALSMHVDVAFVSVHHLARIAFIVATASILANFLGPRRS